MKKYKRLIKQILLFINIIIHLKNEPFFNIVFLYRAIFRKWLYSKKLPDFSDKLEVTVRSDFIIINYEGKNIYYPIEYGETKTKANFNSILKEQSRESPHRYHFNLIKKNWVVYDIGTAEGYQVFSLLDHTDKIFLFEPEPSMVMCLENTFLREISENKVNIINYGIGIAENQTEKGCLKFDRIDHLVKKYNLPAPNYIKADIEGNEMNLLENIIPFIMSGNLKIIEITTYHRPNDFLLIPEFLNKYGGHGMLSEGYIFLNINSWNNIGNFKKLHQPIIRKVLYTHYFY